MKDLEIKIAKSQFQHEMNQNINESFSSRNKDSFKIQNITN